MSNRENHRLPNEEPTERPIYYLNDTGQRFVETLSKLVNSTDRPNTHELLEFAELGKKDLYADGLSGIYGPDLAYASLPAFATLDPSPSPKLHEIALAGFDVHRHSDVALELLFFIGWGEGDVLEKTKGVLDGFVDPRITAAICAQVSRLRQDPVNVSEARAFIAKDARTALGSLGRQAANNSDLQSGRPFDLYHESDQRSGLRLVHLLRQATPSAYSFIIEIIAKYSLKVNEEVCDRFGELIRQDLLEGQYQSYLSKYPALVDPLAATVEDRKSFGGDWKSDFVIRRLDDEYIFVEIEKPRDSLFTSYPHPSTALSHALGQVMNWLIWAEDNISYAYSHGFKDVHQPRAIIVIGRTSALTDQQSRMLRCLNDLLSPRVVVRTFDDLLASARQVVANLTSR